MVDIVREIDKALGKLMFGMIAFGTVGGCLSYLTFKVMERHKFSKGSFRVPTIAMFSVISCIVGGRVYISHMMTPKACTFTQTGGVEG